MLKLQKVTFDAFPGNDADLANVYSAAIIHAYFQEEKKLIKFADIVKAIEEEGWIVSAILETLDSDGNEQIWDDIGHWNYSLWFERVKIEIISPNDIDIASISPLKESQLFRTQFYENDNIFTLYSDTHNQCANGVSPNGEEFIPLWTSENNALSWQGDYPEYRLYPITKNKFIDWLLPNVEESSMMIAYGTGADYLITGHPQFMNPTFF